MLSMVAHCNRVCHQALTIRHIFAIAYVIQALRTHHAVQKLVMLPLTLCDLFNMQLSGLTRTAVPSKENCFENNNE